MLLVFMPHHLEQEPE
jgi:hypothetical protein